MGKTGHRRLIEFHGNGLRIGRRDYQVRWRWIRGFALGVESGHSRWRGTRHAGPGLHLMLGVLVVTAECVAVFAKVAGREG